MKQLAVVVPALLDHDQRRYHFIDENGRIDGMFLVNTLKTNHHFQIRWNSIAKQKRITIPDGTKNQKLSLLEPLLKLQR